MVKYLVKDQINTELRNLIKDAKERICLISPYIKFTDRGIRLLNQKTEQGIETTLIYGKREKQDGLESIMQIRALKIMFYKNLHAKCYYNEEKIILTSMNIYDYSMENNFEMGILVRKDKEPKLYQEIVASSENVIYSGKLIKEAVEIEKTNIQPDPETNENGYCIRCRKTIPRDPKNPYCGKDMKNWKRYNNPDYTEDPEKKGCCHLCGEPFAASMNNPICERCTTDPSHRNLTTEPVRCSKNL